MKAFARLAVLILFLPALLLAQTSTGQSTAGSKASDTKPAYAQTESSGTQQPASSSSSKTGQKASDQNAAPAMPKAPAAYPIMSDKSKERARQIYGYFAHGQMPQFYAAFSPQMKKQSPEAKLITISKQVTEKLGTPGEVLSENFLPSLAAPATLYTRTVQYSKAKVPVTTIVAINGDGDLVDFQISPVPTRPRDEYSDYQDSTKLRLPFNGSWAVMQGGRTVYDNAFVGTEDSRYSVSFMYLKDGMPFENQGRKNSDYYCYGQPVLSPAAGVIVQMGNNSSDHPPGRGPEIQSRGNYVVIAHGNSEFSLIPYLKAGSVKVRNGQRVKQGEVVGECGNSGSSFAPHLEYSLQNTRGFPLPKTMPAQFVDYTADGKPVAMGEPLRGQTVSNEPKAPPVETAAKP